MSARRLWGVLAAIATLTLAAPAAVRAQAADEPPLTYEVKAGDTLYDLARAYLRYPSDYRVLQRINRVADPRRLPVGASLTVPVNLLRTTPAEAKVISFRGDVTLTSGAAPRALAVGLPLSEGDVIATGRDAFVRVQLSDGGHFTVPSQSRVRLAALRRYIMTGAVAYDLDLLQGRIENKASTVRRPGAYRVRTPLSVSAVRGTEFRVAYDEAAARSVTGVLEGVVNVAGEAAPPVSASAAEGVSVSGDGAVVRSALLMAPGLQSPDRAQTGAAIELTPVALEGAAAYRLRLGADAGFIETVAVREVAAGETARFEDAPDGVYFVRISAISADGVEGRYADYSVLRARNGLGGLAAARSGRGYRFRWQAVGEGEASFRFQLRAAGEARVLIDQSGLSLDEITITDLPPGVYDWRVEATRMHQGRAVRTWSAVEQLRIGR